MSTFILLLILLLLNITNSLSSDHFNTWSQQHNKNYSSVQEKLHRLKIFQENYEYITKHNSLGNLSYSLSLNALSDLTHEEFKSSRLGLSRKLTRNFSRNLNLGNYDIGLDIPDSVDWRKSGAVTNVKDQGSCASYGAFFPPPPPSPTPTKCSIFTSCSQGETCCCAKQVLGLCLSWSCCDLESAVCCKDHRHCCPHDYPICDIKKQQCLKRTGNGTLVQALQKRASFRMSDGLSSLLEALDM